MREPVRAGVRVVIADEPDTVIEPHSLATCEGMAVLWLEAAAEQSSGDRHAMWAGLHRTARAIAASELER